MIISEMICADLNRTLNSTHSLTDSLSAAVRGRSKCPTDPCAENEDIKLLDQHRLIGQNKLHQVDDSWTECQTVHSHNILPQSQLNCTHSLSPPLSSNRQHSETDDCLEDNRKDYCQSNAMLCIALDRA